MDEIQMAPLEEISPGAAWKQRLTEDMTAEARELLGAGFVPDYYQSAAAGFVMIAEAAIGEVLAENERLTDRWTELRERTEKGRDALEVLRAEGPEVACGPCGCTPSDPCDEACDGRIVSDGSVDRCTQCRAVLGETED